MNFLFIFLILLDRHIPLINIYIFYSNNIHFINIYLIKFEQLQFIIIFTIIFYNFFIPNKILVEINIMSYKCRSCRTTLFTTENVMTHERLDGSVCLNLLLNFSFNIFHSFFTLIRILLNVILYL